MSRARTPESTGTERWRRSAEKIEVLYLIRQEWLSLGLRTRSVLPVPEEWEHYFEDLRRGRFDVGSTFGRFFDTLERRQLGWEGRRTGERVIALAQRYLDLCIPADVAGIEAGEAPTPKVVPNTYRSRAVLRDRKRGAA